MKKFVGLMLCLALAAVLFASGSMRSEGAGASKKNSSVLIVYYSLTNTTADIANALRDKTGADVYLLEPQPQYSVESAGDEVAAERERGVIRELRGTPDLSVYDLVLVGGPVWSGLSNPVRKYLSQADFGGKKVAGFWTASANIGKYAEEFKSLVKNAEVLDGLSLTATEMSRKAARDAKIDNWVKALPITK